VTIDHRAAEETVLPQVAMPVRSHRRLVIRPVSASALRIGTHVRTLLEYRDLFWTLSVHRIKVRYKQSFLGVSWAILQPLSLMLMYTLVFSLFVKVPTDGAPYVAFVYAALLPWSFFATVVTNSTNSLVTSSQLVTKIYFPREVLPLTYVVAGAFDLVIASGVLAGLLWVYRVPLTLHALWAPVILAVLMTLAMAIGLALSIVQVWIRDIGVAVPLVLQLWMFASPVVYPLRAVPSRLQALYMLNPLVGVIENFRRVILLGEPPDLPSLLYSAVVGLAALALVYVGFKRMDPIVADVV
jgi:lipopolysaccharide transport system permease protein